MVEREIGALGTQSGEHATLFRPAAWDAYASPATAAQVRSLQKLR